MATFGCGRGSVDAFAVDSCGGVSGRLFFLRARSLLASGGIRDHLKNLERQSAAKLE